MTVETLDINIEDVKAFYKLLGHKHETEIRLIDPFKQKPTLSKFVKSKEEFVKVCLEHNGKFYNLFAGINERRLNGTEKDDVITLNSILIDIDTKKLGDISTDEELSKASELADKISDWLISQEFNRPIKAMSGNGYHLLYTLEPTELNEYNRNDIENHVKQFLKNLNKQFENDYASVDVKVGDLSRVTKVIGTKSIKGIETIERPHRVTKFISIPERKEDRRLFNTIMSLTITNNFVDSTSLASVMRDGFTPKKHEQQLFDLAYQLAQSDFDYQHIWNILKPLDEKDPTPQGDVKLDDCIKMALGYRANKRSIPAIPISAIQQNIITPGLSAENEKPIPIAEINKRIFVDIDDNKRYQSLIAEISVNNITPIIETLVFDSGIVCKSELTEIVGDYVDEIPRDKDEDPLMTTNFIKWFWDDAKKLKKIREVCFELGAIKKEILFDEYQNEEVAEWVKGRYCIKRIEISGKLIYFNNEFYKLDTSDFVKREARKRISKISSKNLNEIEKYIEDTTQLIEHDDIERHSHLKCLKNGTFNLQTGEFSPEFNPDNIILNQIPHNYNPDLSYETIEQNVRAILEDETQTYYDFLGTCLHPYTNIDFMLGVIGIAGSGKSQLAILAGMVLGEDNISYAKIHDLARDHTILQDIMYKMLNFDEDLDKDSIKETGTIKKIVTQDSLTLRGIYERSATGRPSVRLGFLANGLFEIANESDQGAIYDRTHLIKANTKFRGTENEVKDIMRTIPNKDQELSGFISYLLQNAHEIYKAKKIHKPQTSKETASVWNEYGNNIKKFVDEWVTYDMDGKLEKGNIWAKWFTLATENKYHIGKKSEFYKIFDDIVGMSETKIRLNSQETAWGYAGIRLKIPEEMQTKLEDTKKNGLIERIKLLSNTSPMLDKLLAVF